MRKQSIAKLNSPLAIGDEILLPRSYTKWLGADDARPRFRIIGERECAWHKAARVFSAEQCGPGVDPASAVRVDNALEWCVSPYGEEGSDFAYALVAFVTDGKGNDDGSKRPMILGRYAASKEASAARAEWADELQSSTRFAGTDVKYITMVIYDLDDPYSVPTLNADVTVKLRRE